MLPTPHSPQDDQSALVRTTREIFDRSPLFQDTRISEPQTGPGGRVSVEVRSGSSPALFCIVAPCSERAYAILHELAVSLAGVECAYTGGGQSQGEGGRNGVVDGLPSPGVWTG